MAYGSGLRTQDSGLRLAQGSWLSTAPGAPLLWLFAERFEIAQLLRRFVRDAPRFVRAAHWPEVAPCAGAFRRRGGQESELDGAIDDLQRLETATPVRFVDRNLVIDEATRRCAVEQPARFDLDLQRLLDREAVQHGLQDRASPDHGLPRRPVFARLVVGDAQYPSAGVRGPRSGAGGRTSGGNFLFDQIDRPSQFETVVHEHGVR